MVVVNRIQKTCKATGCGKSYLGAPASKFCSDECRKIRFKLEKPKFEPTFTIISPTPPLNPVHDDAYVVEIKQERKPTLSLPTDKLPVSFRKPGSVDMTSQVKSLLLQSVTLDQVISNILTKHKYKDPKNCVSHIEDLLLFAKG